MRFVREVTDALAYCHVDVYKDMMNPLEDQLKRNPDDARQFIINQDDEQRLIQKYGVVHNDLHSNNIMRRNRDGRFVLLDFGLAIQNGNSVKSSSRMDGAVECQTSTASESSSLRCWQEPCLSRSDKTLPQG